MTTTGGSAPGRRPGVKGPTSSHAAPACSGSGGATNTTGRPRPSAALASSSVTRPRLAKRCCAVAGMLVGGGRKGNDHVTSLRRAWHQLLSSWYTRAPWWAALYARWGLAPVGAAVLPWAAPRVPFHHGRIALVTAAGVHPRSAPAFDMENPRRARRSEEHTSELQSRPQLVCRLLLEKTKSLKGTGLLPRRPRIF